MCFTWRCVFFPEVALKKLHGIDCCTFFRLQSETFKKKNIPRVSANQYPRSCKNEAKREHQNQQDILPVAVLPKSSIQNDLLCEHQGILTLTQLHSRRQTWQAGKSPMFNRKYVIHGGSSSQPSWFSE